MAATRYPDIVAINQRVGARTVLAMPMLRGDAAVGLITIRRMKVKPFTPKQIALLRVFADQAAIAIENARLFNELQVRNRGLTDALEQQTATAEILRVISTSPADIQPVMQALVENAARLCQAQNAQIFRVEEGGTMRLISRYGPVKSTLEVGEARAITRGSVSGRADRRSTGHRVPDLLAEVEWSTRTSSPRSGARASARPWACPCSARASPSGR